MQSPLPPGQPKFFTLYGLKRPDENIIRYIGITCQRLSKRLRNHVSDRTNNPHKTNWIHKMFPLRPEIIPLSEGLTFDEATWLEEFVISGLRQQNFDLLNLSSGGERGSYGVKRSPEFKRKIALARSGKKASQETRLKIAEAARSISQETRLKRSIALKGNKNCVGNTNCLGKVLPQETRIKISLAMKGKRNNPNGRRKVCLN